MKDHTRDEWKEGKTTKMLNGTVFYTDGSKSATKKVCRIYGVNRPICKSAANLRLKCYWLMPSWLLYRLEK